MQQPYIVYYVDVTSQVGKTASYTIQLTSGLFNATFSDVPDKHWASSYIQTAYSMGVTTGSLASDGSRVFKPSDNATRQEIAVFMCNLLGIDASAYSGQKLNYKDSKSVAKWAQNAVKAVTALGIMQGDNGNFKPSNSITRQEFMAVMVRAAALDTSLGKASTLNAFKDKNKVSSWAKVYVQTAVAYKLVNGDNGYLKPLDKITRAEIVKIMVCAKDFVR